MTSKDLEETHDAELAETGGFGAPLGYDDYEDHFQVVSHDLVNDENGRKIWLVGVPLRITKCIYRPSSKQLGRDMLTCEAIIASEAEFVQALTAGYVEQYTSPGSKVPEWLYPEARIVFNDGSTGIRNQVTSMLHYGKLIDVPESEENNVHRWSVESSEWALLDDCVQRRVTNDGDVITTVEGRMRNGRLFSIKARRGLRESQFALDLETGKAIKGTGERTFYLS